MNDANAANTVPLPSGRRKRVSLRSFQNELVARLAARKNAPELLSQLGFQAMKERFLCNLLEVEEILMPQAITSVPLTRPWFLGLTNVRGNLYGVIDFSLFLGKQPTLIDDETRMLLLGRATGAGNIALLVQRIYGLRNTQGFAATGQKLEDSSWNVQNWMDAEGNIWKEIRFTKLAQSLAFQYVGR
ncbi:MAG: chemotaxis protein CheW [Burkholderiales bacterium]|jgi:twitching motility protein PilI|nr:chemotaxis protein CheW [Burkholderiales bacterium]